MNAQEKIDVLNGVVGRRTPKYVSLGDPSFDRKLLSAHYVLAKLYSEKGDIEQANLHLGKAETEFHNMARVKMKKPEYVTSEFDVEGYRKQQAETRKSLEKQRSQLIDLAQKTGYNTSGLLFDSSIDGEEKEVELIGDPWRL